MSEKLDLKEIERKAWRSFFDDGLWDIYLGLLLFLMGVSGWLDTFNLEGGLRMGIYIGLLVIAMVLFWAGKRFITVPRIGRVKFNAERQLRRKITGLILFGSVVFGLLVMLLTVAVQKGEISRELPWDVIFPGIYALNMLVVFGLGGYFLQFERLYYIGVCFALPVPLDFFVKNSFGIDLGFYLFTLPALVVIAVGVFYLARFLQAYPVLRGEE